MVVKISELPNTQAIKALSGAVTYNGAVGTITPAAGAFTTVVGTSFNGVPLRANAGLSSYVTGGVTNSLYLNGSNNVGYGVGAGRLYNGSSITLIGGLVGSTIDNVGDNVILIGCSDACDVPTNTTSNYLAIQGDGSIPVLKATSTDTTPVITMGGATTAPTLATSADNTWTHQQVPVSAALTSSSNLTAWNVSTNQDATYTLTENTTLSNPTNMVANARYSVRIVQAASAKTLAFGNAYKFPGGFTPAVSTGSGAVDIWTFRCTGTLMELIGLSQNVS